MIYIITSYPPSPPPQGYDLIAPFQSWGYNMLLELPELLTGGPGGQSPPGGGSGGQRPPVVLGLPELLELHNMHACMHACMHSMHA